MDGNLLNSMRYYLFFVAVYCAVGGAPPVAAQSQKPNGKLSSLVVLQNKNVLEGIVRADFEKTVIETLSGSRIIVPTEQVAMVCENYNEAFEYLRSQIDGEDFASQAELVPWCIRFKQFDQAQRLIDRLQFTRISPQTLDDLSRQLSFARDRTEKTRLAAASPTRPNAPFDAPPFANVRPEGDQINVVDPMIQKANFETLDIDAPKATPVSENSLTTVPIHTLEKTLDHVPEFGRSSFKRVVEPILVKNCAAAGCHNRQQKSLPLLELGHGLSVPKRMSQQNLFQVMHFVGDGQPQNSLLIQQSLTAHHTQKQAAFKPESREHLILQEWVALMADPVRAAQIPQKNPSKVNAESQKSHSLTVPAANASLSKPKPDTLGKSITPAIPDLRKRKPDQSPTDAFDPEIFNRQFLQKQEHRPDEPHEK